MTGELFLTRRFSTELSATFVNPEAILFPSHPPPNDVDLGTLGLQTTALTARWNFRTEARLSAFAGAGAALVTIGNLDDQFGDAVDADFDSEPTFLAEAGLRFRPRRAPRLSLNATLSYMPLTATPIVHKTNVALPRELSLDPITFGVGATWRF
jgi:outer membrane protein W